MLITVEIPDAVLQGIDLPASAAQAEVKKEVAVAMYARGLISLGKAVEFSGAARPEFEGILAQRRIERPYDAVELERDLAWAKGEK